MAISLSIGWVYKFFSAEESFVWTTKKEVLFSFL